MDICGKCGKPLGSSGDCEECLKLIVERGAEEMDETSAKRAESEAGKWLARRGKSAPRNLFMQVELLAMMLRDYLRGEYRQVPWATVAAASFTILYAVNPFDLLPDFIPGLGWIDDLLVAGIALTAVQHDLLKYCEFKGLNRENYGL
ncbi:MAG: hypothetical protein Kow0099_31110 [Candidatus Abyssubacteria bacterium]